jgi:hypothetical protein
VIDQIGVSVLREVGGTVVFYALLAAACWLVVLVAERES